MFTFVTTYFGDNGVDLPPLPSIPNLIRNYDFADDTSVTLASGEVQQIDDLSISGLDATATGSTRRPFYNQTVNGFKVGTFNGAKIMTATNFNVLNGWSVFVQLNNVSLIQGTNGRIMTQWGGAGSRNFLLQRQNTAYQFQSRDPEGSLSVVSADQNPLLEFYRSPTATEQYISGVFKGAQLITPQTSNGGPLYIGGIVGLPEFVGNVCQILVYGRSLNGGERTLVRTFFSDKWQQF